MNLNPSPISRRRWMLGTLAVVALGADDPRLDAIRSKARKAELAGFDESESAHYVALGDAPRAFREEALAVCEGAAADYFKILAAKGFRPSWPGRKLAVVVLLGPKSYAQFEGTTPDQAVGGHFDLEEDRLVMFDFRGPGANPRAAVPEQDNTLALVHEAIHQLTFDTGLLDLKADTPLAISEGMATFGETWSPQTKSGIGAVNLRRRKGLDDARKKGGRWIPLARLLADDKPFEDRKAQQIAYAEAWLLINKLMNDPARLPGFRAYLAALREDHEPDRRVELATTHLGDLDRLDKEVRQARP